MPKTHALHVKKTLSLPRGLVEQMQGRVTNLSAFVAEACREKLEAEARRAREADMIERCRVRYPEDLAMAEEFFAAEQDAWDLPR